MKKYFAAFFVMAMLAVMLPLAASAQTHTTTRRVYRNGHWHTVRVTTRTNPGRHYGWTRGRHYGWYNRNRTATITPSERRRLARQRNRLGTLQTRIIRDGVVTNREARRLDRRTDKYVRKVNKARNN